MNAKQYPKTDVPEVMFVGRSNAGKSSLINCLLGRRGLARVAREPGKTRGINFYNIEDKLCFVDLPGYGYARVSKEQKFAWPVLINTYVSTRVQLKLAIMLVDIRRTPSCEDKTMHRWIVETKRPYIVVATKADKVSKQEAWRCLQNIRETLGMRQNTALIKFSRISKEGRDEILSNIEGIIFGKANVEGEVNEKL